LVDVAGITLALVMLGLLEGVIYGLFALGLTLIFGVAKILNLAHGDLGILGAYAAFWFLVLYGTDPLLSLLLVLPLLSLMGIAIQKFAINVAIRDPRFQITASVMITYGLALFISSLETIVWGPDYRSIGLSYSYVGFSFYGMTFSLPRLITLLVTIATAVFFLVFLRTKLGKAIRACAQDREAAQLLGINFERLATVSFCMSVAASGLAGVLYVMSHTLYPAVGLQLTIKGLTVMVLGGIGSVEGAFVGGILLGIIEAVASFAIGNAYRELMSFLILVLVLLIRPRGLFGKLQ